MDCKEQCEDHQELEVTMAFLKGQLMIIILLLLTTVGFSGWSALVSTNTAKDVAVWNGDFKYTAKDHEKKYESLSNRVKKVEEVCYF